MEKRISLTMTSIPNSTLLRIYLKSKRPKQPIYTPIRKHHNVQLFG